MTLAHVTDHITQGLDLLLEQFKNKPKLAAVLTPWLRQFQEIEDALWDLRMLKTASALSGEPLNMLGRLVGQAREGRDDATYRLWIRARARVNRSFGRTIDVIEVAQILVGADVSVRLQELWPASMIVHANEQVESLGDEMAKLLRQTKAAGVALHFRWNEGERPFRFAPGSTVVADSDHGFGAAASGDGITGLDTWTSQHTGAPGFQYRGMCVTPDGVGLAVAPSGILARSLTEGSWADATVFDAAYDYPNMDGVVAGGGNSAIASGTTATGGIDANLGAGYPLLARTLDGGAAWAKATNALLNTYGGFTDLRQIPESNASGYGRFLAHNGSLWVRLLPENGATLVSANGLDWSIYAFDLTDFEPGGLRWVTGVGFVAVGIDTALSQAAIQISADGQTWSRVALAGTGGMAYDAAGFGSEVVVVGAVMVLGDLNPAQWRKPVSGGAWSAGAVLAGAVSIVPAVAWMIAPISDTAAAVALAAMSEGDHISSTTDALLTVSAPQPTGISNPTGLQLTPIVYSGRGRVHAALGEEILASDPITVDSGAGDAGQLSTISNGRMAT